jgi:sodium transport system permease protein
MSFRDVLLVAGKELRETLRDRRTLAVMVLFPLVVYPLVSLLLAQVMATRVARGEAQPARVAVSGAGPAADDVRARLGKDPKALVVRAGGAAVAGAADVEAEAVDAAVIVGAGGAAGAAVRIVFDETREASGRAHERVVQALANVLPAGCAPAYHVESQSIAPRARVGGYVLSKILPLIVVVMVMLGAFYPAIDITAGERERGTLETILSAPVGRFDLMTGKVLAVATLAAVTGLLNMASMSLTLLEGVRLVGAQAAISIPWTRAAATLLVVIPTAFLFGAVMVAIGSMARSFKEAQTLLTPVYFLCFTPSLIAGLGDYDLGGGATLLPGVNVTLLARDLVVGKARAGAIVAVVASTLAYGALALGLASRLYDSERLLAADEGNLRLGAWLRRLLFGASHGQRAHADGAGGGGPEPGGPVGPTLGHAVALYGLAWVLLFFVFSPLQSWRIGPGLLLSEWGGLLGLVALYARSTGQTLAGAIRLRRPRAASLVGAALLGLSAWAVVGLPFQWLVPAPEEMVDRLRRTLAPVNEGSALPVALFLMALTPAVCEEALFRGPILRGLRTRFSPLAASVLTGLLFGLYHVDLWRLLPTGLLGVTLSLIALRSDSIVPAMVTHFMNNACLLTLDRLGATRPGKDLHGRTEVALFAAAAVVFAAGALLVRRGGRGVHAPQGHL